MALTASDLKLVRSVSVSNTAGSNGGKFSANEVLTGVSNNLFPNATMAERAAGLTTFRKAFLRNVNSEDLPLISPKLFVENYTPGDDAVVFHAGTQTDLQSALTGSEKLYGCGKLDANVTAGATSITVLLESSSIQFFANTDSIRISDKATIDGAGNEEYATISGTPSLVGSVVTLPLAAPLQNSYLAASTRVANVYSPSDLETSIAGLSATTAGDGDYNNSGGTNLVGSNLGSVEDTWTLTFTSATAFTCSGASTGAVAGGSTLSDYAPVNPANSAPYFTVGSAGFTGTWASGDTLVFTTHPAAIPLWVKRVIPAGAAALSGNKAVLGFSGEAA